MEIKVRVSDTNAMGFAHVNNYFVYFDEAFVNLLSAIGFPPPEHMKRGIAFPVVESRCTFHAPAIFGDVLEIKTKIEKYSTHSMTTKHWVYRKINGTLLAEGTIVRVAFSLKGKKVPLAEILSPQKQGGP